MNDNNILRNNETDLYPPKQHFLARINPIFLFTVLIPTLFASIYFGFIASDVYISEASFVVRSPEKQTSSPLGMFLKSADFSRAQDDTYTVQEFMLSRDALKELEDKLSIGKKFADKDIDIISRFGGLNPWANSFEQLFKFYKKQVSVELDTASSISTLTVRAFSSEDAWQINKMLLDMSERLINQLNERGRHDMIKFAANEVADAESKAKDADQALSAYRNKQVVVNPEEQAKVQFQQVAKLQEELIATRTQLSQIQTFTKENPQIPVLQNRLVALETERDAEIAKIAGDKKSLANKAGDYQRLALEREFADKQLATAHASLLEARNQAQRQQLYLERVSHSNQPDHAMEPRRILAVSTTFFLGLIAWGILTLLAAGVREHHE